MGIKLWKNAVQDNTIGHNPQVLLFVTYRHKLIQVSEYVRGISLFAEKRVLALSGSGSRKDQMQVAQLLKHIQTRSLILGELAFNTKCVSYILDSVIQKMPNEAIRRQVDEKIAWRLSRPANDTSIVASSNPLFRHESRHKTSAEWYESQYVSLKQSGSR